MQTGISFLLYEILQTSDFLQKFLHALQCHLQMLHGIGVGDTDMSASALAECAARNDCHLFGVQQLFAKFLIIHACGLDGREDVECALRLEAAQTHGAQTGKHKPAAQVVLLPHICDIRLAGFHRLDARKLADCRRGHDAELVDLDDRLEHLARTHDPAQTPAGHRIGFGKTVDDQRALAHSRQLCKAHMLESAEGQLTVDLV